MVSYKVLSRHNSYKDAVYKCMYVSLVHVCVFQGQDNGSLTAQELSNHAGVTIMLANERYGLVF